ncbi:MAG: hypothetical protein OEW64_13655 [Gammaproteobacteria bacterium]|nr:hypothetical protein [Gammaproteobacteria bacterium]MDH5305126.1 hypothetical protein [Gammaproteobacteria bacterium]MDH5321421.1 hypothetical protein [Gammaproteobacteria bacterium]
MGNTSITEHVGKIAIASVAIAMLAACAQTQSLMSSMHKSPSTVGEPVILGAPDAEHYLSELYALAAGDPATQAEIYADAASGARLTPGPQTSLRFALVLATPGHGEYDPEAAQPLLRELLAQTSLLTPAEISLATINLKSVEQSIVLAAEARRARASSSQAAATEEAATQRRLATVEAENRRLRRELAEAEDKLEAITSIERSIGTQN